MPKFFLVLLLLLPLFTKAQSVTFSFYDSRIERPNEYIGFPVIIKSTDDKILTIDYDSQKNDYPFPVKQGENFELRYHGYFGEQTLPFHIEPDEKKNLRIRLDSLPEDSTFHLLKSDENLLLNYSSRGFFHYDTDALLIRRVKNTYLIKRQDERSFQLLNAEQVKILHAFFRQLYALPKQGGCTTVDNYEIRRGKTLIRIDDGGCRWNGWRYLEVALAPTTQTPQ